MESTILTMAAKHDPSLASHVQTLLSALPSKTEPWSLWYASILTALPPRRGIFPSISAINHFRATAGFPVGILLVTGSHL